MVLQKCPFVLPNPSVDVLSQEGMLLANNPVWWSSESRGMMTPFDGPCVSICSQTQSAGVSGVTSCVESFPENFDNLKGTSILTILQQSPELGIPDLARRTNRGNQFHKQAHKTQMIAKKDPVVFHRSHHASFSQILCGAVATERFRSSGNENITR